MCVVLLLVGVVILPALARADGASPGDAPSSPAGVASFVGQQASGLSGIGRVAVASDTPLHLSGALGAGYGLTEAQGSGTGSHHRALGSLGIAVQPLPFLAVALMLDGRWDKHPNDVLGSSTTAVGEPRLLVRATHPVGSSFALGAELGLWVPGSEAPSVRPEASTLDARGLFTYAPPGSALALALNAGYRVDRSANAIRDRDRTRLRRGDLISLQLSDFDAVLVGIGASKRLGDVEVLGELTWDVLVGNGAPAAIESPLRAGAGARYHVTSKAQIELRTEIGLGARAASGPADPLVPIEPRFAIVAGLRWTLPLAGKVPPKAITPPPPPLVREPTAPIAGGVVQGRVTGEAAERGGLAEPLAGARVSVIPTEGSDERVAETSADGSFHVTDVRAGRARVVAKASGFEDATAEVEVEPRAPVTIDLVMKRVIKPGQLRGLVRSFNGKALAATVRVEPLGIETKTDADGTFQIDVPPGAYEVVVASPGHAGQRRPVQVEANGVTILNADLRPGHP